MTEVDKALQDFQQHVDDPAFQSKFYDLFLNANFFVPTMEDLPPAGRQPESGGQVVPLVIEAEGNDYLMLFDSEERLRSWAQAEVSFVEVPGHVLAEMSEPPLHWALNVGSEHAKQFLPDEIAWLREVVARCNARAAEGEE
jgi:hypothetical protein